MDMGVPDPSSLTWGQLSVTRAGSGSAPFALSHEPGGIRIRLAGIGFSTPRYTIRPKPSRPGRARITGAAKVAPNVARVNFYRPVADGGARITGYVAACRQGTGRWHYASGTELAGARRRAAAWRRHLHGAGEEPHRPGSVVAGPPHLSGNRNRTARRSVEEA